MVLQRALSLRQIGVGSRRVQAEGDFRAVDMAGSMRLMVAGGVERPACPGTFTITREAETEGTQSHSALHAD